MKRIIIGLVITGIAIGILSVSFIYSQTQEPATTQTSLPTVEDLIKKVEENVEKIHDLRADVKETEQEMNISKTEFSVKEVLKTTEYTFLFKKPDTIKIIPKPKPDAPKTKEELEKIRQQHPEWTEEEFLKYYQDEYLSQNIDLIAIGQAEYYVDTGTNKLTDKMPFAPSRSGSWENLLEPRQLHLVHNRLRKLLEPFIMQNALTVKKDEKSPDVYIIEGTYKGTPLSDREKTSPHGWDWSNWEPLGGDTNVTIKIDYKKGVILESNTHYTQDFTLIENILVPIKFMHLELRPDKEKEKKFVQTVIEFSNIQINKGIKDKEFYFENTKEYNIEKYRIKLLNEK